MSKTKTQSAIRNVQAHIDAMSRATTRSDLYWHWGAATGLLDVAEAWSIMGTDEIAILRTMAHDTYASVAASIAFAH